MVVTNTCLNKIRDWVAGTSATPPSHIAVGSDDTVPEEDNTMLNSELMRKEIEETSKTDKKVEFRIIIPSTALIGETLKEVGLFNASSDGDMFLHAIHTSLSKTSTIDVEYVITLTFEGE